MSTQPRPGEFEVNPFEFERKYGGPQQRREFVKLSDDEDAKTYTLVTSSGVTLEEDTAYVTHAINCILAQANCPTNLRAFFDYLMPHVFEAGDDGIEASDKKLAELIRPAGRMPQNEKDKAAWERWAEASGYERTRKAAEDWIRNNRRGLKAWQKRYNYSFVVIIEGDYDRQTKKNRETRYSFPILKLAADAVMMARSSSRFAGRELKAIEEAARGELESAPEVPPVRPRKPRPAPDPLAVLARNEQTILTLLQQARDLIDQCESLKEVYGDAEGYLKQLEAKQKEAIKEPTKRRRPQTSTYTKEREKSVPRVAPDNSDGRSRAASVNDRTNAETVKSGHNQTGGRFYPPPPSPSNVINALRENEGGKLESESLPFVETDTDEVRERAALYAEAGRLSPDESVRRARADFAEVRVGDAVWDNGADCRTVFVTGELGVGGDGRHYVSVKGSQTGIPFDEVVYLE